MKLDSIKYTLFWVPDRVVEEFGGVLEGSRGVLEGSRGVLEGFYRFSSD